jgi:hypothetical protein
MQERIELKESVLEKVIESAKQGNAADVEKYARQLDGENSFSMGIMADMINLLLTYMGKEFGEEKVRDAWLFAAERFWKPAVDNFKTMSHDQVIEAFAALHRGLGSEFRVEQDDDKATISITGCGTAGKLMKDGKYENTDRHPHDGGLTQEPHSWSCNKKGMPYYCVHAPVMYQILPKKWGWDEIEYDWGRQFDDDGNPVNEPCKVTIHKKK